MPDVIACLFARWRVGNAQQLRKKLSNCAPHTGRPMPCGGPPAGLERFPRIGRGLAAAAGTAASRYGSTLNTDTTSASRCDCSRSDCAAAADSSTSAAFCWVM